MAQRFQNRSLKPVFNKDIDSSESASTCRKSKLQLGTGGLLILATQEAEIRRSSDQSQPRQLVHETLSQKIPITNMGWWSGYEFKSQYCKK
jgi:hypothetical protein